MVDQSHRDELRATALQTVCPCYYYALTHDDGSIEERHLIAVVEDPMYLHYLFQTQGPNSTEDFLVELASCPCNPDRWGT